MRLKQAQYVIARYISIRQISILDVRRVSHIPQGLAAINLLSVFITEIIHQVLTSATRRWHGEIIASESPEQWPRLLVLLENDAVGMPKLCVEL